jgi:hypothetical protein
MEAPNKGKIKWEQMERDLRKSSLRYYVYDSEVISQKVWSDWLVNGTGRQGYRDRYEADARVEIEILEALEQHPARTRDPDLADIFIVPTRVGATFIRGRRGFHPAFADLMSSQIYMRTQGHRHVLLALNQATFDYFHRDHVGWLGLGRRTYRSLVNVTLAKDLDTFSVTNASLHAVDKGGDYADLFANKLPVSHSGFSIGLGTTRSFPFVPASLEKFQNSSIFLFYQTREEGSEHNSTQYRHAPVQPHVIAHFPDSSLRKGNMDPQEWMAKFMDSRFCLIIRGDTPHSHALLRALKIGCIPVVVSDYYPVYSPILKSTLNLHDFCIFISERDFLRDPVGSMNVLRNLTNAEIQEKIDAMAFAQKVALHDHPESLFVPAFVKEAVNAMENSPSELCPF